MGCRATMLLRSVAPRSAQCTVTACEKSSKPRASKQLYDVTAQTRHLSLYYRIECVTAASQARGHYHHHRLGGDADLLWSHEHVRSLRRSETSLRAYRTMLHTTTLSMACTYWCHCGGSTSTATSTPIQYIRSETRRSFARSCPSSGSSTRETSTLRIRPHTNQAS